MNNLFVADIDYQSLINDYGSPLLILDKATIRHQYAELSRALPNVTLHYALKPLPHPTMVEVLNELGASFDLATNGEVDLVKSFNVNPAKCIHTHPIKKESDIEYALNFGNKIFVFDNEAELKEKLSAKTVNEVFNVLKEEVNKCYVEGN